MPNHKAMWLRALDRLVMPLRCVFCGTKTTELERFVCEGCDDDLPRIPSPPPPAGSPLAFEVAPVAYSFPVDAAVKALKFRRRLYYAPGLSQLLHPVIHELPGDIDAVQPVPLHWRRRWFRGFNQAVEIGRPVANKLGVPLVAAVRRVRATPFQSGLSARERASNLKSAFVVRGSLQYAHVLIVDDVITTGTTMRQIARVLKGAGVERVSALAVARAV